MFENLQEKLQRAFKSLRGEAILTEENISEALKQIRLALLEADVNFKVVKELIDRIQAKAIGQDVLTALSPGEQVIKIVRDELVATLGQDTAKLKFASQPPTVVLMAGLQGSGKTTTSGKLANWLKNGGHRPLLVSVDVYRPAAREQLKVVAAAIKANLYEGEVGEANTATVERLAKEARREAINSGCDVLIVDTAGRLHLDDLLVDAGDLLRKLVDLRGDAARVAGDLRLRRLQPLVGAVDVRGERLCVLREDLPRRGAGRIIGQVLEIGEERRQPTLD